VSTSATFSWGRLPHTVKLVFAFLAFAGGLMFEASWHWRHFLRHLQDRIDTRALKRSRVRVHRH
jgi:hypothetical protein